MTSASFQTSMPIAPSSSHADADADAPPVVRTTRTPPSSASPSPGACVTRGRWSGRVDDGVRMDGICFEVLVAAVMS